MTPNAKAAIMVVAAVAVAALLSRLWTAADQASTVTPFAQPGLGDLTPAELARSVFVGLAVAPGCEAEAARTIHSIFAGARVPHVVHVGVVQYTSALDGPLDRFLSNVRAQYDAVAAAHTGSKNFQANIRTLTLPRGESRGQARARAALETELLDGERYLCYTVPGLTFAAQWDRIALEALEATGDPRAIVTTEPGYAEACGLPTYPRVVMRAQFPATIPAPFATATPSRPFPTPLWVPAWSFGPAAVAAAVPSDPSYRKCDEADQLLRTVRLLSHGYSFYTPTAAVACWADAISTDKPRAVLEPSSRRAHLGRALALLSEDPCDTCGQPRRKHAMAALGHEFEPNRRLSAPRHPHALGGNRPLDACREHCGGAWYRSKRVPRHTAHGYLSRDPPQDERMAKGSDVEVLQ